MPSSSIRSVYKSSTEQNNRTALERRLGTGSPRRSATSGRGVRGVPGRVDLHRGRAGGPFRDGSRGRAARGDLPHLVEACEECPGGWIFPADEQAVRFATAAGAGGSVVLLGV